MSPAEGDGGVLTRGTVTVDRERCKGCELCIPACRPGVLTMSVEVNAIGYRFPELAPGCTGCRACHAVCPDYVFEVYKYDEPIVLPLADQAAAPNATTSTDEPDSAERGEPAGEAGRGADEGGEG